MKTTDPDDELYKTLLDIFDREIAMLGVVTSASTPQVEDLRVRAAAVCRGLADAMVSSQRVPRKHAADAVGAFVEAVQDLRRGS